MAIELGQPLMLPGQPLNLSHERRFVGPQLFNLSQQIKIAPCAIAGLHGSLQGVKRLRKAG